MSAIPTTERAERFRNVTFLSTPSLWPAWPYLPLVRRTKGALECGVLSDLLKATGTPGFSATVYLTNLFTLPPTLEEFVALPKETFDTAEEVFEAGWRID